MPRKKKPDLKPREYYGPCLKNTPDLLNDAALRIWFTSTEPPGELPDHTKIMHTAKAKLAIHRFISGMALAVIRNSQKLAWQPGTPLPGRNSKFQPLSEAQEKPGTFLP